MVDDIEKIKREIAVRVPGWQNCHVLQAGGRCFVAAAEMVLSGIGPAVVTVDGESAVIPTRGGKPVPLEEYMRGEDEEEMVLACPGPDGNPVFTESGEKAFSPEQKREVGGVAEAMAAVLFPSAQPGGEE